MFNRTLFALLFFLLPLSLRAVTTSASNPSGVTATATATRSGNNINVTLTLSGHSTSQSGTNVYGMFYLSKTGVSGDYYSNYYAGRTSNGTTSSTFSAPQSEGPWYLQAHVQNTHNGSVVTYGSVVLIDSPQLTPQTITVTPTTASLSKGGTLSFTVSGHQTTLIFNLPDVTVNPPNWTKQFDQVGVQTLSIYAQAGSGYAQSNTVTITVTVTGYKLRIPLPANTGKHMIIYDVSQGGSFLFSTVQSAGAPAVVREFEVPDPGPATVTPRIIGLTKDGAIWTEDAAGEVILTPSIITPVPITDEAQEVPETPITAPTVPKAPGGDDEKSVWSKTTETDVSAKDKTIKEGSDKIVSAIEQVNATLKARLPGAGGGWGGSTNFSDEGTHTRLDTIIEHVEKMVPDEDEEQEIRDTYKNKGAQASADVDAAMGKGQDAGTEMAGTTMFTGASSFTGSPMPGDNGYALQPRLVSTSGNPILAGAVGGSYDSNPFSSQALSRIIGTTGGTFYAWIRNFIAWATILGFLKYTLDQVNETCGRVGIITPLQLSPSAQIAVQAAIMGNSVGVPVAAGMWALQILAISTAILAAPTIIVGAIYTAGEFGVLFPTGKAAAAASSSGGSALSNILSFSYLILPVTVLVTVAINGLILRVTNIIQTVVITIGLKFASGI